MAWVQITEADLLTVLSGDELQGYREAALALDQPDPIPEQIPKVVNHIRGFVGGCAKNTLGPAGTIPDELLVSAIDLLAVRIPSRVKLSSSKDRRDAADAATKLLEQVARCQFAIVPAEDPAAPEAQPAASGRPSFSGRRRRNVRRESDGL